MSMARKSALRQRFGFNMFYNNKLDANDDINSFLALKPKEVTIDKYLPPQDFKVLCLTTDTKKKYRLVRDTGLGYETIYKLNVAPHVSNVNDECVTVKVDKRLGLQHSEVSSRFVKAMFNYIMNRYTIAIPHQMQNFNHHRFWLDRMSYYVFKVDTDVYHERHFFNQEKKQAEFKLERLEGWTDFIVDKFFNAWGSHFIGNTYFISKKELTL